jgi:hypothetical protein
MAKTLKEMYAKLEKFGVNIALLKECNLNSEELQDFTERIEHILRDDKSAAFV